MFFIKLVPHMTTTWQFTLTDASFLKSRSNCVGEVLIMIRHECKSVRILIEMREVTRPELFLAGLLELNTEFKRIG